MMKIDIKFKSLRAFYCLVFQCEKSKISNKKNFFYLFYLSKKIFAVPHTIVPSSSPPAAELPPPPLLSQIQAMTRALRSNWDT
jgi:hypothetical protein